MAIENIKGIWEKIWEVTKDFQDNIWGVQDVAFGDNFNGIVNFIDQILEHASILLVGFDQKGVVVIKNEVIKKMKNSIHVVVRIYSKEDSIRVNVVNNVLKVFLQVQVVEENIMGIVDCEVKIAKSNIRILVNQNSIQVVIVFNLEKDVFIEKNP